MDGFWQQLASDNARAHAMQNLEHATELLKQLDGWLAAQPWHEHRETVCAALRANDLARWALVLAMGCFVLAILARLLRLTCGTEK